MLINNNYFIFFYNLYYIDWMQTHILTVNWIRHAESCSNKDKHSISDYDYYGDNKKHGYKKRDLSMKDEKLKNPRPTILDQPNIKAIIESTLEDHPNLSFIGMQHAILLGENFIRKWKHDNPTNPLIIFVSPTVRTLMTAMIASRGLECKIYVVPFISEIKGIQPYLGLEDYQNMIIDSYTLKRQILFIKDWMEKNWIKHYDDIEFIELLTELDNLLKNKSGDGSNVEFYKTYSSAIENFLKDKSEHKSSSIIFNILKDKLKELEGKNIVEFQVIMTKINKFWDSTFVRGSEIDFSIYEKYEKEGFDQTPNIDNFYNKVIPYIFNQGIIEYTTNPVIFCVSHGRTLKTYFKEKYGIVFDHPMNTQTFQEKSEFTYHNDIIQYQKPNKSNVKEVYKPLVIRTIYENFEDLNVDVCRHTSIKGIINYPLWSEKQKNIQPSNTSLWNYIYPVDFKKISVDDHTKFYYENVDKYYSSGIKEQQIMAGGYSNANQDTYLKYKSKYITLKYKKH